MIQVQNSLRTLEMVLDKLNMRASLVVLDMPLISLDPTSPMSWDSYADLKVGQARTIGMQLRVMRYLKGTMTLGLHYQKYHVVLEGYNNADWYPFSDDSKVTNGYIFSIAGSAVSWKSKKQTIMARSTMEYEMIALATASEEASWLRSLIIEIPL